MITLPDLTEYVDPGRSARTHQWEHEPRKGICPFAARIRTGDRMAHNYGRLRFTNHDPLLPTLLRREPTLSYPTFSYKTPTVRTILFYHGTLQHFRSLSMDTLLNKSYSTVARSLSPNRDHDKDETR